MPDKPMIGALGVAALRDRVLAEVNQAGTAVFNCGMAFCERDIAKAHRLLAEFEQAMARAMSLAAEMRDAGDEWCHDHAQQP